AWLPVPDQVRGRIVQPDAVATIAERGPAVGRQADQVAEHLRAGCSPAEDDPRTEIPRHKVPDGLTHQTDQIARGGFDRDAALSVAQRSGAVGRGADPVAGE